MRPSARWFARGWPLALLLMLLNAAPAALAADTNQTGSVVEEKFPLLTLRFKDGELLPVNSKVVAGALKPQRNSTKPNNLLVQLEDAAGLRIWSLTLDDPAVQRYEYEDPDEPGRIRFTEARSDDVDFLVRVPLDVRARQVAVFRRERAAAAGTNEASVVSRLLLRQPIPTDSSR